MPLLLIREANLEKNHCIGNCKAADYELIICKPMDSESLHKSKVVITDSCLREYDSRLEVGIAKFTRKVGKFQDFFTKLPTLRNIVIYCYYLEKNTH